ncbi:MAG: TonB-dependent receptor, partial [Chitinophagaceae bacterium]
RNTFTISGHFVKRKFRSYDNIEINRSWYDDGLLIDKETGNRLTDNVSRGKNYGSSLSFKHNFAKSGKEWTADANFHVMDNTNEGNFNTRYFDIYNNPKGLNTIERSLTDGDTRFFTVQTDYINPLSKTSKIEAGLRFSQREFSSLNNNYFRTPSTEFILIPALHINYKYTDKVYAAYATYSQQIKKFSFQTGLRIESSEYDGNFISKNQKFGNEYPFSLFPSVFMTYKVTDKQDFQVNYTRKVNRPNFFQLIPFVDYSDSLNISVGNPDLLPEFTNLVEIGYSNQFKPGHSLLLSLYGKNTNDLITRYQYRAPHPDVARTDSVLLGTFANANSSYT